MNWQQCTYRVEYYFHETSTEGSVEVQELTTY